MRPLKILSCLAILAILTCCGSSKSTTYLKIGTGSQVGVYYGAGLALADLVNYRTPKHGLNMAVEATDGSVFNINAVMGNELDFGFAQADRQYQAYEGLDAWEGRPQEKLRFVCSFHPEILTLIAADDSGINTLDDLRGKKVSIGSPGSGTRGTAEAVLKIHGLTPEVDFDAEGLKASEASMMLQDGRIDAFFFAVGHPNGSIAEATNGKRQVRFIPIDGLGMLLEQAPYYTKMKVPVHYYAKALNDEEVDSIGVLTTLITSADIPDETVYQVVSSLFRRLARFKEQHPSFRQLHPEGMLEGELCPMHPGAERFYREQGWR